MPDLQDQQSDQNHKHIHQRCVCAGSRVSFHISRLIRPIDDRVEVGAVFRVITFAIPNAGYHMTGLDNGNELSWA